MVGKFYEQFPYPLLSELPQKHLETYADQVIACAGLNTKKLHGKMVLDAGCGTGEIACSLATHAKKVVGIDLSKASLAHAKMLVKKYQLKNIEFIEKDAFELDAREKFDVIVSLGMLHHTYNPKKGFEIVSSCVKKDGIFIMGFYHSLGGIKQRVQKFLVGLFAGERPEKKLQFIEWYLGKKLGNHQRAFWADRIANPREQYYRISEIKKWFEENGFEVMGIQAHKPQFNVGNISSSLEIWKFELFLLVNGYRFVIMVGKRKSKNFT